MSNPTIKDLNLLLTKNEKPTKIDVDLDKTQIPLSFQQEQHLFLEEIIVNRISINGVYHEMSDNQI